MKTKIILSAVVLGVAVALSAPLDLSNMFNYANQPVPEYIQFDNQQGNVITDAGATLGRVLFYDKKLSVNNSTSCASCHHQSHGFGDTARLSQGANGLTARHAMRLVNPRFSIGDAFFWDLRAETLEKQTTMPIRDHFELGFSGENGDPDFSEVLTKINNTEYYPILAEHAFGTETLDEEHVQFALAQFIRSIQSFDSPFDIGRAQAPNHRARFFNASDSEHRGKMMFLNPVNLDDDGNRVSGGFGCAGCHIPPTFDADTRMLSNGIVFDATDDGSGTKLDTDVHRAPALRDLVNPQGEVNGQFFHTGQAETLDDVLDHYNDVGANIPAGFDENLIDGRLRRQGNYQKLHMTDQERTDVKAFLRTLTGSDLYTNPKWSNPFDENGNLEVITGPISVPEVSQRSVSVYPNPVKNTASISSESTVFGYVVFAVTGDVVQRKQSSTPLHQLSLHTQSAGTYMVVFTDETGSALASVKLIKE